MKLTRALFIAAFASWLALPMLQQHVRIVPRVKLGGVEKPVERPEFSLSAWFNGSFQPAFERRYNHRFSLRPLLIKSWNQIYYTLFAALPARKGGTGVVLGTDNYLYEDAYIRTYNRNDDRTEDDLRTISRRVRELQDYLAARGIAFLLVIAPSKVEIYPEFVPEGRLRPGRAQRRTVRDRITPLLREAGVNLLDVHEWFLEMKPSSPYPLFSKTGTHWNQYGAALVCSRIMRELERQTGRNFPDIVVDKITTDDRPEGSDGDLFGLLNLWSGFTIRRRVSFKGIEVHPDLRPDSDPTAVSPNLLFVGDSYCLTLTGIMDRLACYRKRDTLYYFKRTFSYPQPAASAALGHPQDLVGVPLDHDALDPATVLEGRDGVVIEINEQWLPKIGFGFIDFVLNRSVAKPGVAEDGESSLP